MKLRALMTYQYVQFKGQNRNFLSDKVAGLEGMKMHVLPELPSAIEVELGEEVIIIFSTNIAYAVPLDKRTEKMQVKAAPKLTDTKPAKA